MTLCSVNKDRPPCDRCKLPCTKEGYDGCLGRLPGAVQACCGHGHQNNAYVVFAPGYPPNTAISHIPEEDQWNLYGSAAIEYFESIGKEVN